MATRSRTDGGTAHILPAERAQASFDVRKLTYLLDGGQKKTDRIETIRNEIYADPEFDFSMYPFYTREERMEESLRRVCILRRKMHKAKSPKDAILLNDFVNTLGPASLHFAMFIPNIMSQGTPEQKAYWLPKCLNMDVFGCYGQTELGHGSNVRGLETTATYDIEKEEFIVNSPYLTSLKWWPGGLGKLATHGVFHCRLVIKGKDYGIHTFIVAIRDRLLQTLPGIEAGDIGDKMGFRPVDNGYLRFTNVRIPRNFMLSKYAKVQKDGTYIAAEKSQSKMGYVTMLLIRSNLVQGAGTALAKAATIAIRYSAVRQQGYDAKGKEVTVLDYQMQRLRLFDVLATCYAFHFTAVYMKNLYATLMKNVESGNTDILPEVHATSSGLKAFCTWATSDGIEWCRRCCGGHGFTQSSGLVDHYGNYVANVTLEGENNIMCLQTARYLIKQVEAASKGKRFTDALEYLNPEFGSKSVNISTEADALNSENLLLLHSLNARFNVLRGAKAFQHHREQGMDFQQAMNASMWDLVRMARAHCYYVMVRNFVSGLTTVEDPKIRAVLTKLCHLFALKEIHNSIGDYLANGSLTARQSEIVSTSVQSLLSSIRPDAVPLVDAFNFHDNQLESCLGKYDGKIYEALYDYVRRNPMNAEGRKMPGYKYAMELLHKGKTPTAKL